MVKAVKGWGVVLMLSVTMGLALILVLALMQPAHAGGGCVDTYTVLRGDTLTRIAQRLGIPYSELLAANQGAIAHPDWIYVGQVLCLPHVPQAAIGSKAVLEVSYRYTPSNDEDKLELPRNGELSKRIELQLLPTRLTTVFTETREISQALSSEPNPVLVGMRNRDANSKLVLTYTLIAIGAGDLLGRLAISDTLPITPSTGSGQSRSLLAFLGQPGIRDARLAFLMEAENGVRMPFYVSDLDVVPDYARFKEFYLDKRPSDAPARVRADDIGFALFSVAGDRYHMMLRLSPDGYGPPYWTMKARCDSWRYRQGWWYWYFRVWYGCSG